MFAYVRVWVSVAREEKGVKGPYQSAPLQLFSKALVSANICKASEIIHDDRRKHLRDLVATERAYLQDLQKCVKLYLNPLRSDAKLQSKMGYSYGSAQTLQIFGNLDDVFTLHMQLISGLSSLSSSLLNLCG